MSIQLLDIIKIADINKAGVSKETRNFLFQFVSYNDAEEGLRENLISICTAEEAVDKCTSEEVKAEVKALSMLASANDCSYIRLI